MKLNELEKEVLVECAEDHNGSWFIVGQVARHVGSDDLQEVRKRTTQVLHDLLKDGLIQAGFPTLDGRGFEPWSLSVNETLDRINTEWDSLGREPKLGEIAWFTTTDEGDRIAKWQA